MTREEVLNLAFPKTVGGMVRPEEPIPTDWDFSTELPQFLRNDLNLGDQENAFLRQLLSNDKIMNVLIDGIKNQLADCDLRIVTEALKGLMSPEMLKKLNGIEDGATKYAHPATHPAAIIALDALHRFVTDTQIAKWDNKEEKNHGNHVPALETADNARYLRNDGTFQTITPAAIGATAATMGGIVGGSLAQNGWVKFANGLILQWGSLGTYDNTVTYTSFPIAFTQLFAVTAQCISGTTTGGGEVIAAYIYSCSNTTIWMHGVSTIDRGGPSKSFYIAIGR